MRIIVKSIGVFSITFLIGTAFYFLIPKTETKFRIPETVTETPILLEASTDKAETNIDPKTFDIENFWDEEEKFNIDFLETGEVSNVEDIRAKSGETWFGLFSENSKEMLRPTKLKIKFTKADGLDWKDISVNEKSEPLFLTNKKQLKSGKIKTLFRGSTFKEANEKDREVTGMKDGFSKKFYLNNVEYTLRTEKGVSTDKQKILVLILETADISQVIHYINYQEGDGVGNLFWVGDLDRDGKLDLYMDFWNYEKGYYSSGIFLSSEAERGNLVKKSEYLMFGGC